MNCYGWMFVSPQNSHVEIQTLNVMIFGHGASVRWLGQEGRALRNGISALIRRNIRERISLFAIWGYRGEAAVTNQEVGLHQTLDMSVAFALDFLASRTVRNKCLFFKPPSLWHCCRNSPNWDNYQEEHFL